MLKRNFARTIGNTKDFKILKKIIAFKAVQEDSVKKASE